MVRYLCHWEVESNLFPLNRTILILPDRALSLPGRCRPLCCGGGHRPYLGALGQVGTLWAPPGKSKPTSPPFVIKVNMIGGCRSSSPPLPSPS